MYGFNMLMHMAKTVGFTPARGTDNIVNVKDHSIWPEVHDSETPTKPILYYLPGICVVVVSQFHNILSRL